VNVTDQQFTRAPNANSNATAPKFINIGAGGPFAPASDTVAAAAVSSLPTGDSGIASALAAPLTGVAPPAARVERALERLNAYFKHLAVEATPRDVAILEAADQFAHDHGLVKEATYLDDLLSGLGS
jgi:hypothetical protein